MHYEYVGIEELELMSHKRVWIANIVDATKHLFHALDMVEKIDIKPQECYLEFKNKYDSYLNMYGDYIEIYPTYLKPKLDTRCNFIRYERDATGYYIKSNDRIFIADSEYELKEKVKATLIEWIDYEWGIKKYTSCKWYLTVMSAYDTDYVKKILSEKPEMFI